jgi:hypothetical protein
MLAAGSEIGQGKVLFLDKGGQNGGQANYNKMHGSPELSWFGQLL